LLCFNADMAPEIVRREEYDGKPVDMWSMGIFLYALLCGMFPFRAKSYPDLYRRIARGTFSMPDELSTSVKDLLSSLLHIDVDRRINATTALRHPWLAPAHATAPDIARLRLQTRILVSDRASDDLDEETLLELNKFGLPRDDIVRLVMAKVHSSLTTVYYLLLDIVDRRRKATGKQRQTLTAPSASGHTTRRAQSAGATRSHSHNYAGTATALNYGANQQVQAQMQQQQQQQLVAGVQIQGATHQQNATQGQQQQFLYSGGASNSNTTNGATKQRPLSAHAGRKT
jgi:serine/threonine protein kinase